MDEFPVDTLRILLDFLEEAIKLQACHHASLAVLYDNIFQSMQELDRWLEYNDSYAPWATRD